MTPANPDKRLAYPLSEAIFKLFGISLADHEPFRNKLNSMLRNGLIMYESSQGAHNRSKKIPEDQLITLHNAVILQAFQPDPKKVKQIFEDLAFRHESAALFEMLLLERRSIVDISLLKVEVTRFIKHLSGKNDLRSTWLANPFETLPQVVLTGSSDLLEAILLQAGSLSSGDSMMAHYLTGDLEAAWAAAQVMESKNSRLNQYKRLIEKEYTQAKEFDDFLDFLK